MEFPLYVCIKLTVCVYCISVSVPVTVSALSMTQPVILQLVSLERMNLSIPPLSSALRLSLCLSLSLSASLLYSPLLHSSSAAVFIVHESLNCCACVWNRVWWRSFGKVHLSDDGVFSVTVVIFTLVCMWMCVHRTSWVACSDFICEILKLEVLDRSMLQQQGLYLQQSFDWCCVR